MKTGHLLATLVATSIPLVPHLARAADDFVVVRDDGTIASTKVTNTQSENAVLSALVPAYLATGAPLPEILSVWTTFPFGAGADVGGTYFFPIGNDTTGLGLEQFYGGDGTFVSSAPPLRSVMVHNDVLALATRAAKFHAPTEGFGTYLFLLETSHIWGPALKVPGPTPNELVGFPFHWSFWMSTGGSPAGGNAWTDNQDGTFTVMPTVPSSLHYSKLDQYLMGLVPASAVPPFAMLEMPVPPKGVVDPVWGGAYAARSFPWFDTSKPFTAKATPRAFTIDEVVTTNGPRVPAAGAAQTSWKVGVVLVVGANDSADQIEAARAVMAPLAATFAPAFHEATDALGTLEIVTSSSPAAGSGGAGGSASGAAGTGGNAAASGGPAPGGGGGAAGLTAAGHGGAEAAGSSVAGAASGSAGAPSAVDGGEWSGGGCAVGRGAWPSLAPILGGLLVLSRRRRAAREARTRATAPRHRTLAGDDGARGHRDRRCPARDAAFPSDGPPGAVRRAAPSHLGVARTTPSARRATHFALRCSPPSRATRPTRACSSCATWPRPA